MSSKLSSFAFKRLASTFFRNEEVYIVSTSRTPLGAYQGLTLKDLFLDFKEECGKSMIMRLPFKKKAFYWT